ncbi:MAG: peptidylprolyl isomerase [Rhodocyclaceae bacterium]
MFKHVRMFLLCMSLVGHAWSMESARGIGEGAHEPLFSVDEAVFTLGDFRNFLLRRNDLMAYAQSRRGLRMMVLEMVDAEIFRREGLRLGIAPNADGQENSPGYYFMVQSRIVPRCDQPSEAQVHAFYEENLERFATPPFVRVSRLVMPVDASIGGVPAARYLADRLSHGAPEFDNLLEEAGKYFDDNALPRPKLGDTGFQPLGSSADLSEATELDRELAVAPVGSVIGPIQTDGEVYLLKVLDRREPVHASWPGVRPDVERAMALDCRRKRLAETREALYRRHDVKLYEETISKLQPTLPEG